MADISAWHSVGRARCGHNTHTWPSIPLITPCMAALLAAHAWAATIWWQFRHGKKHWTPQLDSNRCRNQFGGPPHTNRRTPLPQHRRSVPKARSILRTAEHAKQRTGQTKAWSTDQCCQSTTPHPSTEGAGMVKPCTTKLLNVLGLWGRAIHMVQILRKKLASICQVGQDLTWLCPHLTQGGQLFTHGSSHLPKGLSCHTADKL